MALTIDDVEQRVFGLEGFKIKMKQNGRDSRGDKILLRSYEAKKRTKDAATVQEWKYKFLSQFQGYEVDVLWCNGGKAPGQTLLRTVRASYG